MAVTSINWSDGSGDLIYVDPGSGTGNGTVQISSDPNMSYSSRSKDITFTAPGPGGIYLMETVTVTQEANTTPPYDSKVEYIQTNGTPYIDLGMKGNAATDALYIDFQLTKVDKQARLIAANKQNAPCSIYINGSEKYGYRMASTWGGPQVPSTVGLTRHTWLCDYYNLKNTIDGVDYAMSQASTGITTTNMFLAGPYTTQPRFKGYIYACKIYRSGVLVRDLIPVRVGTTGYMYDNVTKALFGNAAGSGAFTYGNDIT